MAKELSKKEIKEQKKKNKDKKSFGKDFKSELKKVVWPKPAELFKSTVAVIAIVILISVIVFCLDFVFEAMNKYGIDKLKIQFKQRKNKIIQLKKLKIIAKKILNKHGEQDAQTDNNGAEQADNTEATENNVQE